MIYRSQCTCLCHDRSTHGGFAAIHFMPCCEPDPVVKPQVGDSFVWMDESPGEYGEMLERIVEVMEEELPGVWLIGYRDGPPDADTTALMDMLGMDREKMKQTHRMVCRVTKGMDGRWYAVRAIDDEDDE